MLPAELATDDAAELVTAAAELEDALETTGALLVVCDGTVVVAAELDELETTTGVLDEEDAVALLGADPAGASSILNQLML